MTWTWRPTPPAERELAKLERQVLERAVKALDRLVTNYPSSAGIARLQGIEPPEYRIRIGDWRVRFRPDPLSLTLYVLRVQHRREVYR